MGNSIVGLLHHLPEDLGGKGLKSVAIAQGYTIPFVPVASVGVPGHQGGRLELSVLEVEEGDRAMLAIVGIILSRELAFDLDLEGAFGGTLC